MTNKNKKIVDEMVPNDSAICIGHWKYFLKIKFKFYLYAYK